MKNIFLLKKQLKYNCAHKPLLLIYIYIYIYIYIFVTRILRFINYMYLCIRLYPYRVNRVYNL